MIHDILLALLGYPGAVVQETESTFELTPEACKLLKKPEIDLLNRVVQTGFFCRRLQNFIELAEQHLYGAQSVADKARREEESGPRSLYVHALVDSLEETLNEYRTHVVDLERQFLHITTLPLSHLHLSVRRWCRILEVLSRLTDRITQLNLRGGPLLDLLYDASMRSDEAKDALDNTVARVSDVFLKQLVNWIVYNTTEDPYDDFFVRRWRAEMEGKRIEALEVVAETPQAYRFQWNSLYSMRQELVPLRLMTFNCAQKVLFIGRAMRELKQANRAGELSKFVDGEIATLRNLWKTPSVDMPTTWVLERSVDLIRKEVANALKDIVVSDTKLKSHLIFLKGFFLLGFGHFWHSFIDESSRMLESPPTVYSENELTHGPWALATQQEDFSEEFASCFDLRVMPKGFDFQGFARDGVRSLTMIGFARIDGAHLILGRTFSAGPAMVWAHLRQNVVEIARHLLRFQIGTSDETGRDGGTRFAVLFQHRLNPQELRRAADRSTESVSWPEALGEALGLEVSVRHVDKQLDEISLALYLTTASVPFWQLTSVTAKVPRPKKNEYELSMTCKDDTLRASLHEVHLETEIVLSDFLSIELGCGFLGISLLPLGHQHASMHSSTTKPMVFSQEDRPLQVLSWTHAGRDPFVQRMHEIDAWQNILGLSVDVPWPASQVVTDEAIQKYNQLFRLLFAFRRTHIALQRGWCDFKLHRPGTDWTIIRSQMLFFVSQILQYFQQDVIEGLHSQLLDTVEKSRDFEEIRPAHDDFLHQVMCDCFIFVPELHVALLECVKSANYFARLSQTGEGAYSKNTPAILHKLRINFHETVKKVLKLLSTLENESPSLERLLLRIDFNDYFS
eukprot:GEMP01020800.1.p1 GENE.GEMP01020800.1~~GEMP01020800.1.p1  ORF type:complete len:852 (+),score=186.94 GEMP01020800.1:40-2595(+)